MKKHQGFDMNLSNLFSDNGCVSLEGLERYRNNKLNSEEKKAILSHANNCEICANALEGAKRNKQDISRNVSRIRDKYYQSHHRTQTHESQSIIVRLIGPLILLSGLVFILWTMKKPQNISEPAETPKSDTVVADSLRYFEVK